MVKKLDLIGRVVGGGGFPLLITASGSIGGVIGAGLSDEDEEVV